MDRRTFLVNSAGFLLGSLFGLRRPAWALSAFPPADRPPRIALIIDDIGFNLRRAEKFLDAHVPITFSVLPHLRWSVESAQALHAQGHEIMLHQPMEPASTHVDPGPGAIFVEDQPERIHDVVVENLRTLSDVSGVNNHMGSRYTRQSRKMDQVLDVVANQGLFFVDSLTTDHSMAYACARQMGVSATRRDLFIDHRHDVEDVIGQLHRLRQISRRHGSAIGIGHPRSTTAEAILRFVDSPAGRDVAFVHISEVL